MTQETPSFGNKYAVLNLDLMNILVDAVRSDPAGQAFIANCSRWIDAVHNKPEPPLTIFTSLFFSDATQPEVKKGAPFAKLISSFGSFVKGTPPTEIAPEFPMKDSDLVLQKTRWSASSGNELVKILQASKVDTVIISGMTLSGVVMSTVYHLFDLDFNVYIISDNVIELPVEQTAEFSNIMLGGLVPKMNCRAITLDEALRILK